MPAAANDAVRIDRLAGRVRGVEVDRRDDREVVVALGVVDDLADRPGARALARRLPVDHEQLRGARLRPGAHGLVLVPVRAERLLPRGRGHRRAPGGIGERAGRGARAAPSPSKRSREASCTFWNIALRTMTVNARSVARDRPRRRRRLPGRDRGRSARDGLGVRQRLPLVEQAGVGLADRLAEPLDDLVELVGLDLVGHRLAQRPVGVAEVAQHEALGAREPVVRDELGEACTPARTCRGRPTWGRGRTRAPTGASRGRRGAPARAARRAAWGR